MSADSPRLSSGSRGFVPAIVPPQVVSDRSILDSAIGFINDVTLTNQPHTDPKDTITWARFETGADISDPRYGEDWELEGNVAPPLLLILGYGLGVQVWAIPANGEAVEVLSWRHGIVSALRVLPTPATCSTSIDTHGRADDMVDNYAEKRPLVAIVDGGSSTTASAQPQFRVVNFVSLKTGSQVKSIKFKHPVLDVLANRSSVVLTFHERIAVFDARTLEDRLAITTCYPSPGINPNPVALGPRWLAYAEHKLLHSKRSGGGCDGEGVASYTATVLNAAKSLGKGLRELGEQVAAGLTGSTGTTSNSKTGSFDSQTGGEIKQSGIVTILDIKYPIKEYSPTSGAPLSGHAGTDPIVAHFIAHSEAIVAMEFDNSGMLLITADRRGHDFHIFRIQPHPVGPSLAAVHHLYVLHRGDTSAKVQNIAFSLDSRWVAVSTLRGTTHVFPITPYGGPMGVRTHTSLHVVNKLSRFHRSAGLSADGRSSSPISHSESTTFTQSLQPYHNPTLPPFPRPTVVQPLTQLRQPFALGSPPGSAGLSIGVGSGSGKTGSGGNSSQRQRLSSLSDDSGKPLSVCAIFAKSRSWLLEPPNVTREAPHRIQRKSVDSLFVMAGHGALIQYDLDTKLASNVAKEKICDDTPIELEVEAKAQWNLGRRKEGSQEIWPPLLSDNWLIRDRNSCMLTDSTRNYDDNDERTESWLSQVEIITHAGPHRRLWMGPQFVFKTYNAPSGSNLSHVDVEAVEIGVSSKPTTATALARAERSSPLNIVGRSAVPVLIESGSYSSIEQSPKLMDRFRHDHLDSDFSVAHGDTRLKEDLADAMRESPSVSAIQREGGGRLVVTLTDGATCSENPTFYDALAEHDHESCDQDLDGDLTFDVNRSSSSAAALASVLPNLSSYDTSSGYESFDSFRKPKASIEKIVNPLGTVTTVTAGMSAKVKTDILDEVVSQLACEECVIHENCDEALFRPVVAIFCDENERKRGEEEARLNEKLCTPPEAIGTKLVVPVIAKEVDAELSKKEKQKTTENKTKQQQMKMTEKRLGESSSLSSTSSGDQLSKSKVIVELNKEKSAKINIKEEMQSLEKERKEYKVKVVEAEIQLKKVPEPKKMAIEKSTPVADIENKTKPKVLTEKIDIKTEELKLNEKQPEIEKNKKDEATQFVLSKTTANIDSTAKNTAESKIDDEDAAPTTIVKENFQIKLKSQSSAESKENFAILQVESPIKSPEIKTESLNVADLADSLIEIEKTTYEEPITAKIIAKVEPTKIEIPVNVPIAKSSKKKKQRAQSRPSSNSNSENEEVVEVSMKQKSKKNKQKDLNSRLLTTSERRSSISSESSCGEIVDDIVEDKSIEEKDSMFQSFLRTAEKKAEKQSEESSKVMEASDIVIVKPEETIRKAFILTSQQESMRNNNLNEERKEVIDKPIASLLKLKTENLKSSTDIVKNDKDAKTLSDKDKETSPITKNQDTSKGAIKKEYKVEVIEISEGNKQNEIKSSTIATAEVKTSEKFKEPKTPPKSPKKKENNGIGQQTTNLMSPAKVITQQPTKTKKENNTFEVTPQSTFKDVKTEKLDQLKSTKTSKDTTDSPSKIKSIKNLEDEKSPPTTAPTSPWKTLTGAELISKHLESPTGKTDGAIFSSSKSPKKCKEEKVSEKLLPDFSMPYKFKAELKSSSQIGNKTANKLIKKEIDDDFPLLQPLEALPPLPSLESLEMLSPDLKHPMLDVTASVTEQVSLITFESPQKDDSIMESRITQPLRGFNEQNLIFALCGSLHYEDESKASKDDTPRVVSEPTTIPNATNINNNNSKKSLNIEKYMSSSPCSSASEEIIVLEEKKMTKKQKRKRQQQQQQLEAQKNESKSKVISSSDSACVVDEELCPLIGNMADSQNYIDTMSSSDHFGSVMMASVPLIVEVASTTTTDSSEGPMPATTSDDNVFIMPTATNVTPPNKMKTKKLEHKINLIAAIEAAASSSTSSAEESGVEGGGGRASDNETLSSTHHHSHHHHHHVPLTASTLFNTSSSATAAMMTLPTSLSSSIQLSAAKKKTKRRFNFVKKISTNNADVIDYGGGKKIQHNNIEDKKHEGKQQQQEQEDIETILSKQKQQSQGNPMENSLTTTTTVAATTSITKEKSMQNILPSFGNQNNPFTNYGEQSTIVNIDIFEDQLSTSSISTNSRLSLDAQTSSSNSLNGVIDTNLMHFPASSDSVDDVRGGLQELDGVADGASL